MPMSKIMPRSAFSHLHRKPNLLCIIETLGAGGGAEELQVKLLPEICKQGYDVEIVALFDWQPDLGLLLEERGFAVHRLHLAGRWGLLTGLLKLWALRRTKRYRLIWGHLFFGNLYAVLFALTQPATKSIITLHSQYACLPLTTLKGRVSVMIQKWVLGLSTAKVAVSGASAESHTKFFGWQPIEVIHNGVATKDIPPFPNAEERAQTRLAYGASVGDFLLVMPARFIPGKGHETLLEALGLLKREKLCSPKLFACGAVLMALDELCSQTAALQLTKDVRFSPQLRHDELFPLIQAADAVVLPSWREGFGIGAAEAMMLGAPVILTRVGGFIELVGNSECALFVPPGDARALAEAIWELRSDPDLRRRLAERGRLRVVENFDISVCARQWTRVFDRLEKDLR